MYLLQVAIQSKTIVNPVQVSYCLGIFTLQPAIDNTKQIVCDLLQNTDFEPIFSIDAIPGRLNATDDSVLQSIKIKATAVKANGNEKEYHLKQD